MVEPILFASLGALLATLVGLTFLPIFWRRAVRITSRRLIDGLPVSANEIVASQDRLRAEMAVQMRGVERRAEAAIGEATRDRVESARARATELGHLADMADLRERIALLENEGAGLRGDLDKSGRETLAAHQALEQARATAENAAQEIQTTRQEASADRALLKKTVQEAAARDAEIASLRAKLAAADALARSAKTAATAPAAIPAAAAGDQRPHLPKADVALVYPRTELAPASASTDEAAELADLRRRLDEVADAIVAAAEKPVEPSKDRAQGELSLRLVERAGA